MNQAISDLTKSIQFKIFDQWQGVPIINSTYTFESNNTLENVFMPQSNGYLKINTSNIKQVGKYSLNYNNLINLPDPKNLNYSQIINLQESSSVTCKYQWILNHYSYFFKSTSKYNIKTWSNLCVYRIIIIIWCLIFWCWKRQCIY